MKPCLSPSRRLHAYRLLGTPSKELLPPLPFQPREERLQTHPIHTHPLQTPRPLYHPELEIPLLASLGSAANVPLLCAHGLAEALAAAVAAAALVRGREVGWCCLGCCVVGVGVGGWGDGAVVAAGGAGVGGGGVLPRLLECGGVVVAGCLLKGGEGG